MRVALFLLIIGVVTSADLGCAAPADGNGDSIKRIALSFDDAPKGAGPRFSGDERVARYAAAGHLISLIRGEASISRHSAASMLIC